MNIHRHVRASAKANSDFALAKDARHVRSGGSGDQGWHQVCWPGVQIVNQSKIEIDCEFEDDVTGPEVVVSEPGKVGGFIAGERVTVLGKVIGGVRGKMVALMPSARVEGDIHHNYLTIAKGAELTGRCRLNEAIAQSFG